MIIVLLFGAMFMLISNLLTSKSENPENELTVNKNNDEATKEMAAFGQKNSGHHDKIATIEQEFEKQLKEALENIVGVDDVTVVVNVDATDKKVLEKNLVTQSQTTDETDREGGKRKVEDQSSDEQVVIVRDGEKEVPIILETKKPEIRGVLVVANGAENINVKKWIVEAVTRVLDVPSHRVAVMPKKAKGE